MGRRRRRIRTGIGRSNSPTVVGIHHCGVLDESAKRVRAELEEFELASPSDRLPALQIKDRDDVPVLACALVAKADVFVTGDKELLALGAVEAMSILAPRQLWEKLAAR